MDIDTDAALTMVRTARMTLLQCARDQSNAKAAFDLATRALQDANTAYDSASAAVKESQDNLRAALAQGDN